VSLPDISEVPVRVAAPILAAVCAAALAGCGASPSTPTTATKQTAEKKPALSFGSCAQAKAAGAAPLYARQGGVACEE
jgi:hypothetical protein